MSFLYPLRRAASRFLGALVLLSLGALLSGCASDPEDREFFNRGWINPHRDLDGPPEPKGPPPPSHMLYKKDPLVD